MEKIARLVETLLPFEKFDGVAVGLINFSTGTYEAFECLKVDAGVETQRLGSVYFDLASLTKVLTNSLSYFLGPSAFDSQLQLCLDHRGGLPAWGLLPNRGWREQILSYPIAEAPTLYSDFSALRVMLELAQKNVDQKKLCATVWDGEVCNWRDLPPGVPLLQFGFKHGEPNFGAVHDPNAWVIEEFCSHAGLFGTVDGVCKTLLTYQKKTDFIAKIKTTMGTHTHRFVHGWDRVENPAATLAGVGCSSSTFGHLGFTGQSIWIDAEKMIGHVILSNATKDYWFAKEGLNEIRRGVGQLVWSGQY